MNETLEMIQNYAASGKYKRVPVSRELYADAFTPISVMRTLRAAHLQQVQDRQRRGLTAGGTTDEPKRTQDRHAAHGAADRCGGTGHGPVRPAADLSAIGQRRRVQVPGHQHDGL